MNLGELYHRAHPACLCYGGWMATYLPRVPEIPAADVLNDAGTTKPTR